MITPACWLLIALSAPVALAAQQKVQLPARDKVLSEQPAVVYTVGKEDGEEWEILSSVIAAAFDARDNLYLMDSNNYRVLVFDANGKFVRRISQRGEGPGELMVPTGMTVMADGTVVVADAGRRAFSLFKSDGTFVNNVLYGENEGVGGRTALAGTGDFWMEGMHPHPRSGIVAQIPIRPGRRSMGAATGERRVPVRWVDLTASGAKSTALYEFILPSITPKVTANSSGRGVSVSTQAPYWTPAYTIGVLPNGGLAVAHEAEYRVKVVNPAGQVERVLERPIAPRRGTPKEKETFAKRQREVLLKEAVVSSRSSPAGSSGSHPPSAEMVDRLISNATWLEVVPVLRRLTADPQRRIWVARTPADFGVYGPVDILRADGSYVGTVANAILPAAVSKSGRAAFIERDDLGVEHVTVKRLPATWQ